MADRDEESAPLLQNDSQPHAEQQSFQARISTVLAKPSALTSLEKALAALAVFFLLLTATGFGLFAGEAVKLGHETRKGHKTVTRTSTATIPGPTSTRAPVPPSPPHKNAETCLTSTCVTVASTIISAMDTSIDPCDDFYNFANGGWLKNHPIPEGQGFFGSAQDIGERNKRTILEIINAPIPKDLSTADQTNLKHIKSFWGSCLDEDLLDRQGLAPLLDVVNEVLGAWRGTSAISASDFVHQGEEKQVSATKKSKWDPKTARARLTATLTYLHSREIPAFFDAYDEGDVAVDPKSIVLWIKQSGLGLPSPDYYEDVETIEVYTEIIRASLASIYKELGEDATTDIPALTEGVVTLEKDLAKIFLDVTEVEDPKLTYNPKNRTELQKLFPSISFPDYFASYTPRPDYPDPVIVTSPAYLQNLTTVLEGTDPEALEAYFVFRAAQTYGLLLGPKQTVRKEIEWLDNYLGGIAEGVRGARADTCLASLLENYGFLIGRYYVQQAFGGDSKDIAEGIITATIQAFRDRLPELDWLDDATRDAAEEKAAAITHKIGYPESPNTMDPAALQRYFAISEPFNKTDYFGNVLRSRVASERRKWVKIGHPVDEGQWDMIPSEVNAYYSPPGNEIVFPAGILQQPYFSKDWPEYFAFGAFGSVAGHELTHAFDQMGRQYDKDGKLTDWWTKATVKRFESLKGCLLEQYGNYSVLDPKGNPVYINSHFTNGEDMADGGGIAQSYRAWSDRYGADPEGKHFRNYLLPGIELTREQLFFVAYAQGWARNIKAAEAVKRIRTDPHSPTNYRVKGPLSNSPEFSAAFGCKVGQPMSNVKKCSIW
ncbi:zincin [Meredithblackwellia eburnea MCA 4105]